MKTIFIINRHAGKGNRTEKYINLIRNAGADVEIHITRAVGDATAFVREYCEKNGAARFIACGGDGTLCEVLNGAMGYHDAEIGVVPLGTGNDFCRNFGKSFDFSDISAQINGKAVKCDAIKYTLCSNGINKEGYCANMINIGFDCNVACLTAELKKKPFVSGSFAYFLSILINLIGKKGAELDISLDGAGVHNGKLLLTSLANGCYCGGGIKSNPAACTNDGFLNINIIKDVTRFKFISLLPGYMNGTLHQKPGIESILTSGSCRSVAITPIRGQMNICIDGEIFSAQTAEFEIVHNAFDFVLPTVSAEQECAVH